MKKAKKTPKLTFCRRCNYIVHYHCKGISCEDCSHIDICNGVCNCGIEGIRRYYESLIIQMEIEQNALIDKLISKGVNYGNSETK